MYMQEETIVSSKWVFTWEVMVKQSDLTIKKWMKVTMTESNLLPKDDL